MARVGVDWLTELDESRVRTMGAVRGQIVDPAALCALADMEAFATLNLDPMPVDPIAHLRVGLVKTRPYLERLTRHDPSRAVSITERDGYVYPMTPRKILRRVLDHTLDHHNQLQQWLDWQNRGVAPTPTDGWAPSGVTFGEDHVAVGEDELSAWLWRIDRAVGLLIHDAAQLSRAHLDWQPPDGGWTLDRVLHHVARWYGYAAWLDEALTEEPQGRYEEAHQRFRDNVAHLLSDPPPSDTAFYMNAGLRFSLDDAINDVLTAEREVQ
jgi:hypothetical protein